MVGQMSFWSDPREDIVRDYVEVYKEEHRSEKNKLYAIAADFASFSGGRNEYFDWQFDPRKVRISRGRNAEMFVFTKAEFLYKVRKYM